VSILRSAKGEQGSNYLPFSGCVAIESEEKKPEQTAGFQSFRMRALNLEVIALVTEKSNFFMLLSSLSLMFKGCALKLSHPSVRSGFHNSAV